MGKQKEKEKQPRNTNKRATYFAANENFTRGDRRGQEKGRFAAHSPIRRGYYSCRLFFLTMRVTPPEVILARLFPVLHG